MQYYELLMKALAQYFEGQKDWKSYFMHGGCFWLASRLCEQIPGAYLMVNRGEEHCAVSIGNYVYDIYGKVCRTYFHPATDHEIAYMRKNYVPRFDVAQLETFLAGCI